VYRSTPPASTIFLLDSKGLTRTPFSVIWRWHWENSRDPDLKKKLLTYNAEDCEATQRVSEALFRACDALASENPATCVVNADSLKREYPQRFGRTEFLLPEFQKINEAAHWDYQQNRVCVRSEWGRYSQTVFDLKFSPGSTEGIP